MAAAGYALRAGTRGWNNAITAGALVGTPHGLPVTVDLASLFSGIRLVAIQETSLTANQDVASMKLKRLQWKTDRPLSEPKFPTDHSHPELLTVTINPMEIRTWVANVQAVSALSPQ
ncbi:hypothetical protein CYMTET_50811 [Cymbomonas tetramitiformis]|uniref:Uncharacterized protein n=1 Tax=Cymbomonas tetramitiformis TaxID=36881 RepID=A0AAE0BMA4_9CHLO|nr:hypothetical protein CYMTET_50811 [Cymbomonas tetramitiformis]